jgi:hypothetical protein
MRSAKFAPIRGAKLRFSCTVWQTPQDKEDKAGILAGSEWNAPCILSLMLPDKNMARAFMEG